MLRQFVKINFLLLHWCKAKRGGRLKVEAPPVKTSAVIIPLSIAA